MNTVAAFIRYKTKNLGDLHSGWHHYFPLARDEYEIIEGPLPSPGKYKVVVIGGGLLPFREPYQGWFKANAQLGNKRSKVVAWGVGSNTGKLNSKGYDLFSQRERVGEWCPCPSCMMSIFDECRDIPVTQQVVFYQNDGLRDIGDVAPKMGNHHGNIVDVMKFMASAEVVITSSFHGLYWATLLGKKVGTIPIRPKLCDVPWPPVYLQDPKNWKRVLTEGKTYPDSLRQARERTNTFYEQLLKVCQC